jgi:aminopeptidase N
VEQEVLQVGRVPETLPPEEGVFIEPVDVFTNRTSWYPRPVLDDHATAALRFDVPVGFSAVTGGARVSARVSGSRTLVEYRQDRPTKYITAAVGRFQEAGGRDTGAVRLRAFGVARTKGEAGGLVERSSRILAFFSEQFGPCPYPDLDLLLIEGEAPGGHAPAGMMLLQRRPLLVRQALRDDPASFPEEPDFFLAHELAHQWFGQSVAGANYRERWLSEGLAQHAAALWVRQSRGEEAFRRVLARLARWALKYDEAGAIHLGYRVGHLQGDAQAYRAVVYDKAAYVFHMLRGVVGELAFQRGLSTYLEAHRYSKANADDLREALEAASGKDLSAYFRAWVYGTGVARLTYNSRVERAVSGYRVILDVEATGLPGPVPVQVRVVYEGGETTRFVEVVPGATRVGIDTQARPRRVELNADRGLLALVKGS